MASCAVVIGPAHYAPDSEIYSHPEIANSARLYGEVLAADPRWGADRVVVLTPAQLYEIDHVMTAVRDAASQAVWGDTLLVVYVGHGTYWWDVNNAEVHFAVGSSRGAEPHTWLNSWYVYHVMRESDASLKVLIADCCSSNRLQNLGDKKRGRISALPGVLGRQDSRSGTCLFSAMKSVDDALAVGCPKLEGELASCTPFSGHLLNLLRNGTDEDSDELTLGMMRDALEEGMPACSAGHDQPRMILNDARESMALFTNGTVRDFSGHGRRRRPSAPASAEDWVKTVKHPTDSDLDQLLADPRKAGQVVALLRHGSGKSLAKSIAQRADTALHDPAMFAVYWAEAGRAPRS